MATNALRRHALDTLADKTLVEAGLAMPPPTWRDVDDDPEPLTVDGWCTAGRPDDYDELVR